MAFASPSLGLGHRHEALSITTTTTTTTTAAARIVTQSEPKLNADPRVLE
jgi:hypothetical protein